MSTKPASALIGAGGGGGGGDFSGERAHPKTPSKNKKATRLALTSPSVAESFVAHRLEIRYFAVRCESLGSPEPRAQRSP